jgi:hypothetical protein
MTITHSIDAVQTSIEDPIDPGYYQLDAEKVHVLGPTAITIQSGWYRRPGFGPVAIVRGLEGTTPAAHKAGADLTPFDPA